jgi:hypothetical protein
MRMSLGSSDQIPGITERIDLGDLVTVFESGDLALFALVKAALDRAEIRYVAQGEGLQDLFGMGRLGGAGYNVVTGAPRIRVASENAERARQIVADLTK